MDKQNDNIITRETIKKLLLIQNKDSVHDTWALTGVMSFLLVPGLLVSIWFLSEYIKIQWLKVLLCVFAAVLITAPMWVNLLSLRTLSKEKEMIYIVASRTNRDGIMRAIMEKAGVNTDAHGVIFSLPVDSVVGIKEFEGI